LLRDKRDLFFLEETLRSCDRFLPSDAHIILSVSPLAQNVDHLPTLITNCHITLLVCSDQKRQFAHFRHIISFYPPKDDDLIMFLDADDLLVDKPRLIVGNGIMYLPQS